MFEKTELSREVPGGGSLPGDSFVIAPPKEPEPSFLNKANVIECRGGTWYVREIGGQDEKR